jgi:hypothetical protein
MNNEKIRRGERLRVIFEELEPRLLLSADLPVDVSDDLTEPVLVSIQTDTDSLFEGDATPASAQDNAPPVSSETLPSTDNATPSTTTTTSDTTTQSESLSQQESSSLSSPGEVTPTPSGETGNQTATPDTTVPEQTDASGDSLSSTELDTPETDPLATDPPIDPTQQSEPVGDTSAGGGTQDPIGVAPDSDPGVASTGIDNPTQIQQEGSAFAADVPADTVVQQVVFIDSAVTDYETLVGGIIDQAGSTDTDAGDTTTADTLDQTPAVDTSTGSASVADIDGNATGGGETLDAEINGDTSESLDSVLVDLDAYGAALFGDTQIFILDDARNGVEQISEQLAGFEGLNSVHILSHGADGSVKLGNVWLRFDNLDRYAGDITTWGQTFDENGDLLIYGCNLAASGEGQRLVDSIGDLTGADVAASTDDTGHALRGADWDLEYATGSIETGVAISAAVQDTWIARMALVTFQEGVGGYTGTQDTALDAGSPTTDKGALSSLEVDANIFQQGLIRFDNLFGSGPGQIPLGSTINSATLTINVTDPATAGANVTLHRILVPWTESSTYNSMTNGISTDDVEAVSTPDSALVNPEITGLKDFTNLAATVQAWLDGTAPNYGWTIVSDDINRIFFDSSETGTATLRPVLTVDYNAPPVISNATANVDEDAANGTSVYNVNDANTGNDTDQDGDALTYSITAGNPDGIFAINAGTGEITVFDNTNLDFETTNQYVLTVDITITDVNEAPTVVLNNTTTTLPEDTDTTTSVKVADIQINDDALGTNTLALSGADAALFTIVGGNELHIAAGAALDFETNPKTNPNLDVVVEVDDLAVGVTPDDTAALSITITDVNEAPTTSGITDVTVDEDSVPNVVDLFAAFDDQEDPDNALSYAIVTNNNAALFDSTVIDGATGTLTLDYFADANGSADITVRATDTGSQSVDTTFTVTLNAVNDAPENGVPGSQTTNEETSLTFSTVNGNLIAVSDVDAGSNAIEITLNATDGTVSLANTGGLTFLTGTGTGDASMRFTGMVNNINSALDGMTFQPNTGFSGSASLQMITDDLGNTGASGALNDLDTIAIDVVAAPPLPPLDDAIVDDPPDPGGTTSDPIPPVEPPGESVPEPVVEEPVVTIDPLGLIGFENPDTPENAPNDVRSPTASTGDETLAIATATHTTPGSPFPASIRVPSLFNAVLDTITPVVNAAVQPSSDGDGRAAEQNSKVRTLAHMALVNPTLPPLHLSETLWELLDAMKQEINDNDGMFTKHGAAVAIALGVTLTLSAGYVTWLLKFGYLAASLLSLSPMLAQFDPLPMLANRGRDKDSEPKQSKQAGDNVEDTPDLVSQASGF